MAILKIGILLGTTSGQTVGLIKVSLAHTERNNIIEVGHEE